MNNPCDKDEGAIGFLSFQVGQTLRVHPLPNPSPIKGEGAFSLAAGKTMGKWDSNGTDHGFLSQL